MLLSTHAEVFWNPRNKRHYCELGYTFTKMKDPFTVRIEDLTSGSKASVLIRCDYCGKEYQIEWSVYTAMKRKSGVKDCCRDCCEIKASEVIVEKYGSHTGLFFACNNKRRSTNLDRYGCENVFGSEIIKESIRKTNIKRYGVPYTQQCKEVRNKTVETCRDKYGVDNYVELFRGQFIKDNSPSWKGGVQTGRAERATFEYSEWRKNVFARDHYTCQCCGSSNGFGSEVELHAHHIRNWRDNIDSRYDVNNGITLCSSCHYQFHSIYGKRDNNSEQLKAFLNTMSDEKVC